MRCQGGSEPPQNQARLLWHKRFRLRRPRNCHAAWLLGLADAKLSAHSVRHKGLVGIVLPPQQAARLGGGMRQSLSDPKSSSFKTSWWVYSAVATSSHEARSEQIPDRITTINC